MLGTVLNGFKYTKGKEQNKPFCNHNYMELKLW